MAKQIGAEGVVIHTGYQLKLERDEAYKNMVGCVMKAIDNSPNGAKVIIETAAGQGSQIGVSIEDFAELWNMFPKSYRKRLGTCIDTAHIFAGGAEISTVEGTKKYLKDFDKLIGIEHLTLFHLNDSKKPVNSRKDQHQGIGFGYIYSKKFGGDINAFKTLVKFAYKNSIPMILETHNGTADKPEKNEGNFADEIKLVKIFTGLSKNS
jgi:deoxyribonuclease-4